jgi:hypothetical protein
MRFLLCTQALVGITNWDDGDRLFGEVAESQPCSTEKLRQRFFEREIAIRAAGPVLADELAAVNNLNVSFPGECLQGSTKCLRSDIRWLSRGCIRARGNSEDRKTDRSGHPAYAHNSYSPRRRTVAAVLERSDSFHANKERFGQTNEYQ